MQTRLSYYSTVLMLVFLAALFHTACSKTEPVASTFYLNNISGDDTNDGLSPETAWKSLERASRDKYTEGEKLLLCKGCTFYGKLHLKVEGTKEKPVIISSYDPGNGDKSLPIIDAKGYIAAIQVENGRNFLLSTDFHV
ncbi:MAG: hypothetical protein GH151_05735 [Bacteroidetes bacterium]|nr:hypothetical protein [Bacteroidota bacterium]